MTKLVRKSKKNTVELPDFIPVLLRIAAIADQHKAKDIKACDVRGLTLVADAFLLCSASSEPQLRAIFTAVKEELKQAGVKQLHSEGAFTGGWLVMDYGTVIFHIFREEARNFYDLDGLWGDAPQINLHLEKG
ncbi:MAG: ribosome silencing factor [Candidatus Hydrogenedentes bacterium]|nr:ribosome silencing factor [Candidatus Hydrogenedentota bacterium]